MIPLRVLPLDVELTVHSGESVMAAAQRQGYFWPTRCRGQALCTACLFEVVAGEEHFEPAAAREQEALASIEEFQARRPGRLRLGCQARPTGPATIVKRGMKPADTEGKPRWTVLPM